MKLEDRLLFTFEPGCLEPDFGKTTLTTFGKQGRELEPTTWARYTMEADLKLNGSNYGQRFKSKYFDATFNFCLAFDGRLVATLGFEVDEEAIIIWQIQGMKGEGKRLEPIKWSQALVRYCVNWARGAGVGELFIVGVGHNAWAAKHGHLDPARGKLIYDVTAKRCGFRPTTDGHYRLTL